jgi:hypothetical protein
MTYPHRRFGQIILLLLWWSFHKNCGVIGNISDFIFSRRWQLHCSLLECDAMRFKKYIPKFGRKILHPYSGCRGVCWEIKKGSTRCVQMLVSRNMASHSRRRNTILVILRTLQVSNQHSLSLCSLFIYFVVSLTTYSIIIQPPIQQIYNK